MKDNPENKAEKAEKVTAEQAVSLNDTLGTEDYKRAMAAERETASQATASLPNLEIFTSTDVKPVVDQNFDKWDSNKDSKLSKDELNAVLNHGDTSAEEKTAAGLQRAFGSLDVNEDGGIDQKELDELYTSAEIYERTRDRVDAVSQVVSKNFSAIDTDNNNLVTANEFRKAGNDDKLPLTAEERQIMREFGNSDSFDLLAARFDRETLKRTYVDAPNSIRAISQDDAKTAGRRLKGKEVEGHDMGAPGTIHDMYTAQSR